MRHHVFEGADDAFWKNYNLGGCWILPDGELKWVDHRNGSHHGQIALAEFGEHVGLNDEGQFDKYSTGDAMRLAMADGWVQVSIRTPDKGMTVGYCAPMAPKAKRALLRLIRDQPEHMSYEIWEEKAPFAVVNSRNEMMSKMSRAALAEDYTPQKNTSIAFFWNARTAKSIEIGSASHTQFALEHPETLGLAPFDKDGVMDWDFHAPTLTTVLTEGWVRCILYPHYMLINSMTLSDAQRCVKAFRKMTGEFVIDVGFSYQTYNRSYKTAPDVREFLSLTEQMVARDRAASDHDGKVRDLVIHKNPGRNDCLALLANSHSKTLRGFVDQRTGELFVWDAFVADHENASLALAKNGIRSPFPRVVIELENGKPQPFAYLDSGMTEDDWLDVPTAAMDRALGYDIVWKWS